MAPFFKGAVFFCLPPEGGLGSRWLKHAFVFILFFGLRTAKGADW
jgi:hypothetical protein